MLPILARGCWWPSSGKRGRDGPLLIDCSDRVFIDAAGLGVLAEAAHDNGTLTLRGTTPFLRKMLDTVGLSHFIALEERSSGHAA